jgi:hypothetical protein
MFPVFDVSNTRNLEALTNALALSRRSSLAETSRCLCSADVDAAAPASSSRGLGLVPVSPDGEPMSAEVTERRFDELVSPRVERLRGEVGPALIVPEGQPLEEVRRHS